MVLLETQKATWCSYRMAVMDLILLAWKVIFSSYDKLKTLFSGSILGIVGMEKPESWSSNKKSY